MKAQWRRLADWLESRSLRERLLLLAAALALVSALWTLTIYAPWRARITVQAEERAKLTHELESLRTQTQALIVRAEQDPNRALRAREHDLRARLERLNAQLSERAGDFVSPEHMARALREVLSVQSGLRLVRLQTLPPVPLQVEEGAKAVPVYRHGLELEFVGDYFGTLRFLEAVEALPWSFFWDVLDYQVETHPRARVKLRVHTLSGQEAWIGV